MRRELIDNFLNRQITSDKALLTLSEPLAARVGSIAYDKLVMEPTLWGSNLAKTGLLLEMDALLLGFAPEISSNENNFSIAVKALGQLIETEQSYFGCIANMTGPISFAATSLGDPERAAELKKVTVKMAEAFCQKRPDILMLREGAALGQSTIGMQQRKAYNTLKNMAAYYSVPLGIHLEDYDPAIIPELTKLKVPYIFFGADQFGNIPSIDALVKLSDSIDGIGVPVDYQDPQLAMEQTEKYITGLAENNFLIINLKELDSNTDLEATLALVSDLRSVGS